MLVTFVIYFAVQSLSIPNFDSSCVSSLNSDNQADWKEKILLTLDWMNLDLTLRMDESSVPMESSTQTKKTSYERWEQSNRLSFMYFKSSIRKRIRGSIPNCAKVKEYLKAIEQQFETSDKAMASTLMTKMCPMKFNGIKGVREHKMKMRDIATQLKSSKIEMSKSFLVHFIIYFFPTKYGPFNISHNTHKKKWSINELLTMCMQKE